MSNPQPVTYGSLHRLMSTTWYPRLAVAGFDLMSRNILWDTIICEYQRLIIGQPVYANGWWGDHHATICELVDRGYLIDDQGRNILFITEQACLEFLQLAKEAACHDASDSATTSS